MNKGIKVSTGEKIFDVFNYIIMGLLCFTMVYPFWYLFILSIADAERTALTSLYTWPRYLSLSSYINVLRSKYIYLSFWVTIRKTVIGVILSLFFTFNLAYVLSKKYFPNRTFWTSIVVFTMFFSGGLVPDYLLVRNLGLFDSMWALILPNMISAYNTVIMRNFLMSIPESIEESARIDGANDIIILYKLIFPLSLPIIATVGLWLAVGHWNSWFDSMIYIQTPEKQVLQVILRRVVIEGAAQFVQMGGFEDYELMKKMTPDTIKAAMTMIVTIPILIVYPFVQKYFVKGVIIGSLKG